MKNKRKTFSTVEELLADISSKKKRYNECLELCKIMEEVLEAKPQVWHGNIVSFGGYRYDSNKKGMFDYFWTGFASIQRSLVIYFALDFEDNKKLFEKLGKYRMGEACIYVNKLEDLDMAVLRKIVEKSKQY